MISAVHRKVEAVADPGGAGARDAYALGAGLGLGNDDTLSTHLCVGA